jgi:hypothetical protein
VSALVSTAFRPGRRALALLLGAALLLRMGAACFGGFYFDLNAFEEWATFLATHPLATFYTFSTGTQPDHLPGDVIVLAALGRGFAAAFGVARIDSDLFDWLLKMVGGVSDIVIGGCIYAIVRRLRPGPDNRVALIAAACWLFNPAVIFISAIWGQWDAFSLALLMLAVMLLLRGQTVLPWPLFAWACLVKPQLIALAPILLIFAVREHGLGPNRGEIRRLGTRTLAGCGLGVLVVVAISYPFDVGLPGMGLRWDLAERVMFAVDRHTPTVAGAFNLWGFIKGHTEIETTDLTTRVFGLTARSLAMILTALALTACYVACWRLRSARIALIWGLLFATLTLYLLPTRIHERYLLPALPFAAILVAFPALGRLRWLIAGLTAPFFVSLYLVYDQSFPLLAIPDLRAHLTYRSLSALNLLLYLWVGATGIRLAFGGMERAPVPQTGPVSLRSPAD